MKTFITFLKKEFLHVLRDRKTLLILFGMPIAQMLIFGFALTNEVKNAKIVVIDYAKDESSRKLQERIEASQYFEIQKTLPGAEHIENAFREGVIKIALVIPVNFGTNLMHQNHAQLSVIADATDPNTANTLTNYVSSIIRSFQQELSLNTNAIRIVPETRMLYNPQLKGSYTFVPGVMALILLLLCVMMTAVSIVREKELGTMEVLLVSPFKPIMVMLSKAIPYLILSLINVVIILLLSVYLLELRIEGSILLLMLESTLFIITCLSLGIFISVKTESQQAAMLFSLMGMMLPTILFSGFMFPIENMPKVFQIISNIVPSKWYYIIVKSIMIKGIGIAGIWKETLILAGMTAILLLISLKSFKIRLA